MKYLTATEIKRIILTEMNPKKPQNIAYLLLNPKNYQAKGSFTYITVIFNIIRCYFNK